MRGVMPESVRARRSKTVFQAEVRRELEQQWPAYEAAFGPSATPEIAQRGYVDRHQFWSRLVDLRDGRYGPDQVYLLEMVGLETWLRALRQPRRRLAAVAQPAGDSRPLREDKKSAGILIGNM